MSNSNSPTVPGDPNDFTGAASWYSTGSWTLNAGQTYMLNQDHWVAGGDSDPEYCRKIGNAVMETNGTLLVPYAAPFILGAYFNLNDFIASPSTSDQLTLVFTYVPGSKGTSPQFTLGTIVLTAANPTANFSQRSIMQAGDQITISVTSTNTLNNSSVGNLSLVQFNSDSNDGNTQLYGGVSGTVPSYNQYGGFTPISHMTSGVVSGGKGLCVLTCTQDGSSTGQTLFPNAITFVSSIGQASSAITTPTQAAVCTLNPYPSDRRTVEIVLTQPGAVGQFVPDGYKVNARIDGI